MESTLKKYPIIENMRKREEVLWFNSGLDNRFTDEVTKRDIDDASKRLARFAPYINAVYPETDGGIIESPLLEINKMKARMENEAGLSNSGRLFIKCDNNLPVSGSIKARGGIYEVLCFAEDVALKSGLLKITDNYSVLAEERFKNLFSEYKIAVGSTGNLGLSVGIMGAKLGFKVNVHMSSDARQWKKDLLREKGAEVIEYAGDYGKAVEEGRKQAESDPKCHFVDDENSKTLFLGYSVAGERLARQLKEENIAVDESHPLFVYLPCGVGGGPGGVAYGIKQIYGENARCFFAEPIEAPCMLLGIMTGLNDKICAQDIGLTGKTVADGLAVSRASAFVGRVAGSLLDGLFTVSDKNMERLLKVLYESEGIFVEPSAAAGFPGFIRTRQCADYIEKIGEENMKNAAHVVWATGGGMVPAIEKEKHLNAEV